jgi:hypothetical protein
VVYFGGFFPKLEFSRGFLYVCIIYISGRISAAVRAGDIIFFSLADSVGYYTGNIIHKSRRQWFSGKIYAPGNPSSGLKRSILFMEILQGFSVYFVGRISEAAMGGPRSSFRVRHGSVGCSVAQKGIP